MFILNSFRTGLYTRHLLNRITIKHTVRTLFSEQILRISEYETQRMRMPPIKIDEKKIVFEMRTNNTEALVNSIKQWIHVLDKRQCENNFLLLQHSLRAIHKCDETKTYIFGPAVMRMLHFLNLPEKALELACDLQLESMFNQLSSTLILYDMLFNNAMYKELFQLNKKRMEQQQRKGMSSSRLQNYLMFAACYKLNTQEHWDFALQLWDRSVKEHQLTQSMNFLSMLAVNQDHAEIALDILPDLDKHFSSTNIRIIALANCGKFEEISEILTTLLQTRSYKISADVMQRVRDGMGKYPADVKSKKLSAILDNMQLQKRTTKTTIDEILCWPISHKLQNYDSKSVNTRKEGEMKE